MEQTTVATPRRLHWLRRIALLMAALVACLGTVTVVAPSPGALATFEELAELLEFEETVA